MMKKFFLLFLLLEVGFTPARSQSTSPVLSSWLDAARNGDTLELRSIWTQHPNLLQEKDSRGSDALILATYYGHLPAVQWLLAAGADPKSGDVSGNTALMGALFRKYEEVAKVLVQRGADINQPNFQDATAMHFAIVFSTDDMVLWLLENKGDPSIADRFGTTVWQQAEIQGRQHLFTSPQ
jgi:ankyrin repeat protein